MNTRRLTIATVVLTWIVLGVACAPVGGPGRYPGSPPPREFPAYFSHTTTFGNYDVSNPRLAEGQSDGQYAIVGTHGSLTLDIGNGKSFYASAGPDIHVFMADDRPANYTVHVRNVRDGEENWTEIARGRGSSDFEIEPYYAGPADFLQIRNEGTNPLYIDALEAYHVRED